MEEKSCEQLKREKTKAEQQLQQHTLGGAGIDDKIDIIKAAIKEIEELKDAYYDVMIDLTRFPERSCADQWQGKVYDNTTELFYDNAQVKAGDLFKKIDEVLDRLNDKKTTLIKEKNGNDSIISRLKNLIADLQNEIEKFVN